MEVISFVLKENNNASFERVFFPDWNEKWVTKTGKKFHNIKSRSRFNSHNIE
jgi:hypothetical protein